MPAKPVLIVVWDGFRPDDMSWDVTPNLVKHAEKGVTFTASRCAYPPHTRVNCASLATGSWPAVHGLSANTLLVPETDPSLCSLADRDTILRLADLGGGNLFGVPSLGTVLADAGRTMAVVSAASPGSTSIVGWGASLIVGDGFVAPAEETAPVEGRFGPSPGRASPDPTALNRYMARATLDYVLPEVQPDVLLVWMCEPDATQHVSGLGSKEAREVIAENDEILGSILDRIGQDATVIVTSDHGHTEVVAAHATTSARLDEQTGLRSGRDYVLTEEGIYLLVPPSRDAVTTVLRALRGIQSVGTIFTKEPHPEAMPMTAVQLGGRWVPDVKYSHRWTSHAGPSGYRGRVEMGSDCPYPSTHGTLGSGDMNNLLVVSGDGFRDGYVSPIPCGIVDIAPTVLGLLEVPVPATWQGRVLTEALVGRRQFEPAVQFETVELRWNDGDDRGTQTVTTALVEGTPYVWSGTARFASERRQR